ncbi:PREDICTED: uncharacterized protein LOC104709433 [Camelina sativa]|uniref:Uncharacterized protein LOC104709433 n=1 Tax=Camelina sativa TaxID=90675 RepID=A0ABM1QQD8_CAMSA|nr:PREDICTED: uncharacterized protein LOC104709433 [Camelina sativa]
MDNTRETKFLLFDSIATEIIGEFAPSILRGSLDEISDPEALPEPIKNLVGKTFVFLVCVEQENIWEGKDSYRVTKLLSKDGLLEEENIEKSADIVNPASIISGDQVPLALTYSQETNESSTPSSKCVYAPNVEGEDQASSSKKVCVKPGENSAEGFGVNAATLTFEDNK